MLQDELVLLGDILDFLEWRRVNRGVQYFQALPIFPGKQLPAVRFYYHTGRIYTVSNKGQLYRLKELFSRTQASKISCCAFGNNQTSWVTPGLGIVTLQTEKMIKSITLKEEVLSSFFENGYIAERHAQQCGNRLIGVRRG